MSAIVKELTKTRPTARLRCAACNSEDMSVIPQGSAMTLIVCGDCGFGFEVAVMRSESRRTTLEDAPAGATPDRDATPEELDEIAAADAAASDDAPGTPDDDADTATSPTPAEGGDDADALGTPADDGGSIAPEIEGSPETPSGGGEGGELDPAGEAAGMTDGGGDAADMGGRSEGAAAEADPESESIDAGAPTAGTPVGHGADGDASELRSDPAYTSSDLGRELGTTPDSLAATSDTSIELIDDEVASAAGAPIADLPPMPVDAAKVMAFNRRIGDIMVDNKYDREVGGQRRGRLDGRALYKISAGGDRVFKRPTERKNKSYNVVILVDESGSMGAGVRGGRKVDSVGEEMTRAGMAADAAKLLVDGLTRNGVHCTVIGFNRNVTERKSWGTHVKGQRFDSNKMRAQIVAAAASGAGGCNHDYAALRAAQDAFDKCPDPHGHKVLIAIADGGVYNCGHTVRDHRRGGEYHDATSGVCHGSTFNLKHAWEEIAREVDTVCVGIDSADVETWYHAAEIVKTPEAFMDSILRRFSKLFRRGA
jgi:hypothetical protein